MELIFVFIFFLALAYILLKMGNNEITYEENAEDEPEEEIEEEQPDYFAEKDDIRADIDTAIAVYTLLSEMDLESTDILKWGMKNQLKRTRRQCLEVICDCVKSLSPEEEEKEES
jgi:Na+-transporting methylmalonyl-CoA/oxaloacetate decarboxylase gamma subunit